jgi:hypothetical protein
VISLGAMKRLLTVLILPALFGALLVAPAPAAADDQAIWDTWNTSHAKAFNKAFNRYARASRRMTRNKFRSKRLIRRTIRTIKPVVRILGAVAEDVAAVRASSDDGRAAKGFIAKSLAAWRKALRLNIQALRQVLRGHRKRALRIYDRIDAQYKRSDRFEKRAVRALREAGVDTSG